MKFKLFVLALVGFASLGSAEASRETVYDRTFHVGIEAGAIFSNLRGPEDVRTENRTGFAAGVVGDIGLSEYFSLQPEAIFAQRGSNLTVGDITVAQKYNSLEFPVFAKLKFPSVVTPYLIAGPTFIFNLSESVEASGAGGTVATGFRTRTFDMGAAVGAGVEVGPVFATARYTIGITDVNEDSAQWHSRGVHLLGGVRL